MSGPLTLRAVLAGAPVPTGPLGPPESAEPDDEVEPDTCPGCDSTEAEGCPRSCPERALDDDANAYLDRCRG